MIREMTATEINNANQRVSHLYQSEWLVDNLTAILMDVKYGAQGMGEASARDKAHAILGWLATFGNVERRTTSDPIPQNVPHAPRTQEPPGEK